MYVHTNIHTYIKCIDEYMHKHARLHILARTHMHADIPQTFFAQRGKQTVKN
jgi:hypothetical protein